MIIGIGTDIVTISRIEKIKQEFGDRFLDRVFTDEEKDYCEKYNDPSEHYAVRFAAKEAIAKALGLGIESSSNWKNINITNDEKGKPSVSFNGRIVSQTDNYICHISLSHCTDYATATSVIQLK
tara:strand:+ start:3044 stop:3415 length:372 start_codon:yes stop_codon:yes gene_type:complete